MAAPKIVTTSYLLENLHCPSCVAAIKSVLFKTFAHKILWASPNLVTSVVTIEHEDVRSVSVTSMKRTLEDAGFKICGLDTTAILANDMRCNIQSEFPETSHTGALASNGWSRLWLSRSSTPVLEAAKAAHIENCQACRSSITNALDNQSTQDEKTVHYISVLNTITPPEAPLETVVIGNDHSPIWRATLSIGGMTCAVCSNSITTELQKLPWVSKVVVNLVTHSACVEYFGESSGKHGKSTGQTRAQDVVGAIEDLGYDASLDKVINLNEVTQRTDEREVHIKIDGMFCQRCPDRILRTLEDFGPERLTVLGKPSPEHNMVRLKYTPGVPNFTIRHILRAISATDPSLSPSIYHAPTLEEKSRAIRARHQRELMWREIMTFIIAIPTFVLGIVYMTLVPEGNKAKHHLMQPWTSGLSRLHVILCLLATPVWLFATDVFHRRAIKELKALWRRGSRTPFLSRFYKFGSMDMLMSLGTTIAYVSSVVQMIAAAASGKGKLPEGLFYFDSVVFLTLFLLAGRLIEAYSKSKAGNAVESLLKLRSDFAILVEKAKGEGQLTTTIPLDQLEHGDVIRVPHGASPPADGVIVMGESTFDESNLTGESRLIKKAEGDSVFAGTINKASVVTVRVTGTAGKSMLDQIVEVVREGQTRRAPVEQIADILTSYFVPVITLIAVITWVVWMAIGFSGQIHEKDLNTACGWLAFALQFAIAVFVVACPCGIGLAAPTAIFVGGGLAAKYGVLAKSGGEAFEKAQKVDCVVFDKTGTLTVGGEPQITNSTFFPDGKIQGIDKKALLSTLKAVEENSSHPTAKAIVAFCGSSITANEIERVEELPGKGMKATCCRNENTTFDIVVGNELMIRDLLVPLSQAVLSQLQVWKMEAKSVALVAVKPQDKEAWALGAILSISDPIREEAAAVIKTLQSQGTQVWMLSGDNVTTAQAIASLVGISPSNVLAEVLPSEKAAKITYLQATTPDRSSSRRAVVAMVGDGINDSPALTAADVGIAIGSGSDVAISSADFVLVTSNLTAVLTLLELSRAVFRRIKVNFGWAIVYNALALPLAAGCLYPITTADGTHVRLDPVWASLAMALSSISVVLSSLSLRTRVPIVGFRPTHVAE